MADFGVVDFTQMLDILQPNLPILDAMAAELRTDYATRRYSSERQHMCAWFRGQRTKGGGAYTRDTHNRSAKRTYNRLLNATSVLWIAEALGVDEDLLRNAAAEALSEVDYRRRPAIVRRHVPWDTIAELASQRIGERQPWSVTHKL